MQEDCYEINFYDLNYRKIEFNVKGKFVIVVVYVLGC